MKLQHLIESKLLCVSFSSSKAPTTIELSKAFENVMEKYDKKFRPLYGGMYVILRVAKQYPSEN